MLDVPTYYTVEEVAQDLRVNVETVRRYIKRGELTAVSIGGVYRISYEDYERFVQERKTKRKDSK